MTTITKIFVILVCLFAFIFTPLAVSFAARSNNWRKLTEDYASALEVANAHERSALAIAASEIERYKAMWKKENDQYQALQSQYSQLVKEKGDLTLKHDDLARSRAAWETSAGLLAAEMAVKSKHNEELGKAKEDALARERELRVRNLELSDRVKELSAQQVVLTQQLNQKIQEITAYRDENKRLREGSILSAASPAAASPTPTAQSTHAARTSPILGKVRAIRGTLATIDVGSSSGVQAGMRMVVLRNGDWVCDLEITSQVLPTEAVGEIRLQAENKQIREGDVVEDAESFSRS
ncbi:MAG: hypothetical protein KA354_05135 [Phycisphaerae bacterium]|nr:hypothetical protein [Phycisphaerae bacterium]